MATDGSGPAFPQPIAATGETFASAQNAEGHQSGMSLRDWFAGQALASFGLDYDRAASTGGEAEMVAQIAYQIADAMVAARAGSASKE